VPDALDEVSVDGKKLINAEFSFSDDTTMAATKSQIEFICTI
jgi:hypothetical protein